MLQKGIPTHSTIKASRTNAQELKGSVRLFFILTILFSTTATLPFFNLSSLPNFARNNGFIFISVGIIALLINERSNLKFNKFLSTFSPFVIVGFLTTVLMSFFLTNSVETIAGETPVSAITTGLMWLFFDAAIVFFISHCYAHCTQDFLDRILDSFLLFTISICSVQALVMLGLPGASALFDIINIGDWLGVFKNVMFERLVGIGSEPAAMAKPLGLLCLPYCYCRLANGGGMRYGIAFVLLLYFGFLTKATTVYVTIVFVLLGILLIRIRKTNSKAVIVCFSLVCAALSIFILISLINGGRLMSADIIETFNTVLGKIGDSGNQSTAYRTSTVINDIEILKDYPIFGVGDGNQGFFYAQNLPSWVLSSGSIEALSALSGSRGVLNGGAFIPSILSGYGIVGCALFCVWISFCIHIAIKRKEELGKYYDMFVLAMFACIPICWMAISFQGAPVAVFLIFCLPALEAQL